MKISPSESRILEVLWTADRPLAADEVFAGLGDDPEWTAGTVRTLLTRLVKKKAVKTKQDGRRYLFKPLIDRSAFVDAESASLIGRFFQGRLAPFVNHFAERHDLGDEEIAELRRVVERLGRGK